MRKWTPSREELFAMVWERPSTEVAAELGISDVALAKLCRELQVPKPPRGYWNRVHAGQTPRRPPLQAFREEVEPEWARRRQSLAAQFSKLQLQFLSHALEILRDNGTDVSGCHVTYDGLKSIDPGLAAEVLLLLQNQLDAWLADDGLTFEATPRGSEQIVENLVSKLLPLAQPQVVVFRRGTSRSWEGPAILVRFSSELQRRVAQLRELVRETRVSYVAWELGASDYGWQVRFAWSLGRYRSYRCGLCVSYDQIWLRVEDDEGESFQTERHALREVMPIELLTDHEVALPAAISRPTLRPYSERLRALRDLEAVYDMLESAALDIERAVPDERLAVFERLLGDSRPLTSAREAWRALEADLERWYQHIEAERARLCQDILGVGPGDIVVASAWRNQTVRIRVHRMYLHIDGDDVHFHLSGTRFRKDGTLGKREETISIGVKE